MVRLIVSSVFTMRPMSCAALMPRATVWLNSHARLIAEAETGGYGESRLGRLHGIEALNDFLETKHCYLEAGLAS